MERANENPAKNPRATFRDQPSTMSYTSLQALKLKLGSILLDAQLIHPEELQEALRIAKESQEPVGKILLTLGYLDEPTLQTVLLAQSLIAEGVADQPTAIAAIKVAREKGITLPQALQEAESSEKSEIDCAELDRLIVSSGMVAEAVYVEAKKRSRENRIPLGRALILMSSITFKNLNLVLECVALVRSGRLTEEESVQALTLVQSNGIELDEALKRIHVSPGTTRSRIKLGDILTAAKSSTSATI